jgi:hypothetical protein
LKKGGADALVVAMLDRLGRPVLDFIPPDGNGADAELAFVAPDGKVDAKPDGRGDGVDSRRLRATGAFG